MEDRARGGGPPFVSYLVVLTHGTYSMAVLVSPQVAFPDNYLHVGSYNQRPPSSHIWHGLAVSLETDTMYGSGLMSEVIQQNPHDCRVIQTHANHSESIEASK